MKTYDVHFNDANDSNNKGFNLSKEDAIAKANDMLLTRDSYVEEYAGGTISVVCNETGETVWEKAIN